MKRHYLTGGTGGYGTMTMMYDASCGIKSSRGSLFMDSWESVTCKRCRAGFYRLNPYSIPPWILNRRKEAVMATRAKHEDA